MLIQQIAPEAVVDTSILRERIGEAIPRGFPTKIVSIIPKELINAGCFLDRLTGFWRYEFGLPFKIPGKLIWGTHMWPRVDWLLIALSCADSRLTGNARVGYINTLADPQKHQDALVEMIPAYKVDISASMSFEVSGLGAGNKTVDWLISPKDGRTVLIDVKRRSVDFIRQMERIDDTGTAPEPDHDPNLLLRSIEGKFVLANPDLQLQGAWIVTDIKQDEQQLDSAFASLNSGKVHFIILGDWKPDIYVLVRREEDRQYLLDLFKASISSRFTFKPVA